MLLMVWLGSRPGNVGVLSAGEDSQEPFRVASNPAVANPKPDDLDEIEEAAFGGTQTQKAAPFDPENYNV